MQLAKLLTSVVFISLLLAGSAALFRAPAYAQEFPSRTITIIVPFPPGGPGDIFGRSIAQRLAAAFGRTVIVDNRPGATGNIGAEVVARAAPDGHTILHTSAAVALSRALYPKLSVNAERDLAAVSQTVLLPLVLVVHSSLPARNLKELLALARANPGALTFGSPGSGALPHLAMELLKLHTKLDIRHIPYKGGGPVQTALLTGEVHLAFLGVPVARPHLSSGKIRALGVSALKRSATLPDVPTLHETGIKDFEALNWFGFFVPAKTPPAIVMRIHAEVVKALAAPEMKERLAVEGAEGVGSMPTDFAAFFRSEFRKWSDVVQRSGTKLE